MENTGRMRLRSQITDEERAQIKQEEEIKRNKKVAIDERPFIQYSGKIKYFTTQLDCAINCDAILNNANEASNLLIIGFDMEWPFSFQTGSGKTAVIQISPTLDECFIFHVSTLKNLPKSLTELLAHDNVRLTGVNIKNDIRKLCRDFTGVNVDKAIENCIELSTIANFIRGGGRWSMEKLVDQFFDMRINKDKTIRRSKWHIVPLSKQQQMYAAIDAYVSLKLFHHLKNLEASILVKENDANMENV